MLDDDSLLHIFYLCRPFYEETDNIRRLVERKREWADERWWYSLVHVCQRWRNLILSSPSHLGLCLFCKNGTPVADMLAHSPPLPLVIYYHDKDRAFTANDEEGITLALQSCDRIRCIRLWMSFPNLRKIIPAMDKEYPILEELVIGPTAERLEPNTALILPDTIQAPNLRDLLLADTSIQTRSRFLTNTKGLVTLCLFQGSYLPPNTLLHWLSFMPQLEDFMVAFSSPTPFLIVETQPSHTPIITQVTLPNLRRLSFKGVSSYLEEFIGRVVTPSLDRFRVDFFNQPAFSIPCLLKFISTAETLKYSIALFKFFDDLGLVAVYPYGTMIHALGLFIHCPHLNGQVSFMAQIFDALCKVISSVEYLVFGFENRKLLPDQEEHNQADRAQWRKLLRSFSNTKTLRIDDWAAKELSRCLGSDDGEDPLELLPELQELAYSGTGDLGDTLTSFIDARQKSSRPVTLVDCSSTPFKPATVTPHSSRSATT